MKTIWQKHWFKIVSVILILLLSFGYVNQCSNYNDEKDKNDRLTDYASNLSSKTVEYKNKLGETVTQGNAWRLRTEELEKVNGALYRRLKNFSKNPKKIESYTKINTETSGNIKVKIDTVYVPQLDIAKKDSVQVPVPKFSYNDDYLNIDGEVKKDSVSMDYKYKSQLEVVYKWDKKGLFSDPELKIDVIAKNPKEKITGLEALKIEPPAKKWYQTNGFKFGSGFVVGVGVITGIMILTK